LTVFALFVVLFLDLDELHFNRHAHPDLEQGALVDLVKANAAHLDTLLETVHVTILEHDRSLLGPGMLTASDHLGTIEGARIRTRHLKRSLRALEQQMGLVVDE